MQHFELLTRADSEARDRQTVRHRLLGQPKCLYRLVLMAGHHQLHEILLSLINGTVGALGRLLDHFQSLLNLTPSEKAYRSTPGIMLGQKGQRECDKK